MGYRHFLVLGTAAAALIAAPACGSDGEEAPPSHGGQGGSSSTLDCEGRGEQFSAGMAKQAEGGSIQVVLEKSDVAPPALGDNTWTLQIKDANGQPIAGADVQAASKMPDHTHPATTRTGTQTEPGTYEIVPHFAMTGYWETTVKVTPQGGTAGSVMFGFCIPQ